MEVSTNNSGTNIQWTEKAKLVIKMTVQLDGCQRLQKAVLLEQCMSYGQRMVLYFLKGLQQDDLKNPLWDKKKLIAVKLTAVSPIPNCKVYLTAIRFTLQK